MATQTRRGWNMSYQGLYKRMLTKGMKVTTLAQLQDFLDRIDKVLPDNLQNIDFGPDYVTYKALNGDTGNMIELATVTVNKTWFRLSWPTGKGVSAGTINVGTDDSKATMGAKKTMYATVADIPDSEIDRFKDRIKAITGRKRLAAW